MALRTTKSGFKISVVIFITIAYFFVFCFLYNFFAKEVAIISVLPVIIVALFYGCWWGIIAGALTLPANIVLYSFSGEGSFFDVLSNYTPGNYLGFFGIILIGGVIGRMHDLSQKAQRSLRNQRVAEAALRKSQESLEEKVKERTAELSITNKELKQQIEERKNAEKELIKLAAAIEQANETVMILDTHGSITYVNPALKYQMGYSPSELIGTNLISFGRSSDQKHLFQKAWETINKGNIWTGHIRPRSKDGSIREFDLTISPIRDPSGKITSFVSIARNVTKELEMAERLRRSEKMEAIGTLAGAAVI